MKLRNWGLGALTAIAATVGMTAAAAALTDYTYYNGKYYGLAYSYDYFADAAKTEYLGTTWDTCRGSWDPDYAGHANRAYIPTPYYTAITAHHCGGEGPFDMPDFAYGVPD